MDNEKKYGECVGYYTMAESLIKDASRSAASTSGFSILGKSNDSESPLSALVKSLSALITEKKNSAVKDNDLIYHQNVPTMENLAPIEKVSAVKPLPFTEVAGGKEGVAKIIGPDLFQKIVVGL